MLKVKPGVQELESCSGNCVPSARSTSAPAAAALATGVPARPVVPAARGCDSGMAPLPAMVVVTTAPRCSARARSGAAASARMTPPPAWRTGRSASTSRRAARAISTASPRGRTPVGRWAARSGGASSPRRDRRSMGTLTRTGPGRPVVARVKALPRTRGSASRACTRHARLTSGRNVSPCEASAWRLISWKASRPSWRRATSPAITTTAEQSLAASPMPVSAFVRPGPLCTRMTPGRWTARK
ncbi:MAG: hypothetical protein A2X52_16120 [Candidatus Rokubacteria bacterium GWC2_70_16]|nr:MAG: hypothetical protein A2X52_16120 [Candidatus Rokubacteria bacterium GWC2_70_16]